MKNKPKNQKDTNKLLITATLVAALYVAVQHFNVANYMVYGIGMVIMWFLDIVNASVGSMTLNYLGILLILVSTSLIVGFALAIFKQKNAFKIAFMSTMFAYLMLNILTVLVTGGSMAARLIISFVMMFVGYVLSKLLISRLRSNLFIWGIIGVMVLVNVFALPYLYVIAR